MPVLGSPNATDLLGSMGELGIWLCTAEDAVLLEHELNPQYLRYLQDFGLFEGRVCKVDDGVTDCNESSSANNKNADVASNSIDTTSALVPMGTTKRIEEIATRFNMPIGAPSTEVHARVNPKAFSHGLCNELGIRRPISAVVTDTAGLLKTGGDILARTSRICVKESLGVSGKGIIKISDHKGLERYVRFLDRSVKEQTEPLVVEEWIDDGTDVNCQVLINERGVSSIVGLRSAQVDRGVHQGHEYPANIDRDQYEVIAEAGISLADRLASRYGYYGIVGLDALVSKSRGVYPCLEINARLNMSTYQNRIIEQLIPQNQNASFYYINLPRDAPIEFSWIKNSLNGLLYLPEATRGVIVMAYQPSTISGVRRLYFAAVGSSELDILKLKEEVARRLNIDAHFTTN